MSMKIYKEITELIAKLRDAHPDMNHDVNFLLQVLRS